MNKSFITACIIKKYETHALTNERSTIKLLLKIPNVNTELKFCRINAYAYGDIARKIYKLSMKDDYLLFEGSLWTQINEVNKQEKEYNNNINLLFIIIDIQPIN